MLLGQYHGFDYRCLHKQSDEPLKKIPSEENMGSRLNMNIGEKF
jgi:hypothetical protein